MSDDLPALACLSTEDDGRWVELTDGSRAEHADFALPHEITGSVARHYLLAAGFWFAGCWREEVRKYLRAG